MGAVQVGEDRAELVAEHPGQRLGESASTTVTSAPYSRAAAVTSSPIQPAPTTTTRPPRCSAALSASASGSVRRVRTRSPPGTFSGRTSEPVASSSLS